jgi:2-aminoadipate transaminase
MTNWTLAARAHKMNPSVIREILKVTEKPGIISFAGGLPSPKTFPVDAMLEATQRVLTQDGRSALQYAASEGYGPLRDWVAHDLKKQGMDVHADQVLITTGSQQGLDLVAKILIDAGSRILVETPTYLGALQAFTPMEPDVVSVDSDDSGVLADDLRAKAGQGAARARFIYLLPNFQNPTGRTMTEARRAAVAAAALETGVPVIEDNPYGDLWFDTAPPPSLSSRNPEGSVYLGSFSKILAPGLRLGYLVAPHALYPKLLQAKQAADLHTPSFNQRLVAEVLKDGFIERHVPTIRALYKQQCEAMLAALDREMAGLDFQFNRPAGGMFLWARLPEGVDAVGLLPKAVDRGVAFVPGAAFYADHGDPRTLRLSFVTASVDQINHRHCRAGAGDPRLPDLRGTKPCCACGAAPARSTCARCCGRLQELGVPFERIDAGLAYGHNHTPDYLAKNPNALVPLLEDGDFTLWESNAIVRYLCARHACGHALPRRPAHALRRRALDGLAADHAEPRRRAGLHPVDPNPSRAAPAGGHCTVGRGHRALAADARCPPGPRPWMAGEHFTMADIPIGCEIHRWWGLPQPRPALPHLARWYAAVQARPATRGVLDLPLS